MNNPKFVSREDVEEMIELYHLSRTALSGKDDSRHNRIIWAASEFVKKYPDTKKTLAYKDLAAALE